MKRIYLDHIAGTPPSLRVREAMRPFLEEWAGNPQSLHAEGRRARQAVDEARVKLSELIHSRPEEIIFTSSGSESNNLALKGLAAARHNRGDHIILSSIEHPSLLQSARSLEKSGFKVTRVGVDSQAWIDPDAVKRALTPRTVVVSVMLANSVVGTIEPIREIARICRSQGVRFHCDAVAAVGSIPVDVEALGVDALSLAGDQFYGPQGSAALFLRKGVKLVPLLDGGIQEDGKRAGTENVAGIVGLGEAARLALEEMGERGKRMCGLRDRLIRELPDRIEHVVPTGHPQSRLPYHASFCVRFVEGEGMLLHLDLQGIAVASGSACASKSLKASHVLLEMGIDQALAQGSLVFSMGEDSRMEDIERLLDVFPPIVDKLRRMSPLYSEYLENSQ